MSWLKKLKSGIRNLGENLSDAAKDVTRVAAKAVQYAAPVVGSLIGGPLGGGIGTGISALAGQVGPNKSRSSALKRSITYGASVTGGFMALGAISGAGLGASGLSSVQQLFGGGAPQPQGDPRQNPTVNNAQRKMVNPWAMGAGVASMGDPNAAAAGIMQARAGGIASLIGNASGPSGVERSGVQNSGLGGLLNGVLTPEQAGQGGAGLGGLIPIAVIGLVAFAALRGRKG